MKCFDHLFERFPEFETDRCILRQIKQSDLGNLHELFSDKDNVKCFGLDIMKDIIEANKTLQQLKALFDKKLGFAWVIALKENNKMIGLINYTCWFRRFYRCGIRHSLKREYWDQGYLTEIFPPVIEFGFNKMKLHRIESIVNPQADLSVQLVRNFGFFQEALLKDYSYNFVNQKFDDNYLFALLNNKNTEYHELFM
ncbi:MAG: GNAT family N-acetyltransferase [Candidatus Delongbacteria bacterium]|nr:GNAT family N-acetyltransferase [Candidatus Delongbacteria bacterium]